MIKVLIVDDSAVIRQGLCEILSQFDDIQVIGTAADPYVAATKMKSLVPDLIILDIEMPKMDGITFLKKLMSQHPIPVIICSSLVGTNTQSQIKALEYGAIDIILKPKTGTKQFLQESAAKIAQTVRAASQAKVTKLHITAERKARPKLDTDAMLPSKVQSAMLKTTEKVLVVGASTGGTEVIRRLLQDMPADCPPIAIVQHMPEGFTRSFAQRLNQLCAINVKEAEDGDSLLRGHALIAPGNRHMLVERSGARYYVAIKDGPLICRHRPSVNVLFRSAAQVLGRNSLGAILTGMGDDGATGLLEMKNAGAITIGQDEASCVVYGMPKEALKLGALNHQVSIDAMAKAILRLSLD